MRWQGRRESGNVIDQRRMGGGTLGIGGLVLGAIVYFLMGGNPLTYLAQNADQVMPNSTTSGTSRSADDLNDEGRSFVAVVLADTEDVWNAQFAANSVQYEAPRLVLFRGATRSRCGSASAATGPFYCPADRQIYLDLSFFDELSNRLGAKGDTAGAYVIAHEVGHHVQHILGLDREAEAQFGGRNNRSSIEIELQADCLSGIWAAQMEKKKSVIEEGDIQEALGAASAVGDDRLQQMSRGEVVPDSFTHGTSAQREAAFRKGYEGGDLRTCL